MIPSAYLQYHKEFFVSRLLLLCIVLNKCCKKHVTLFRQNVPEKYDDYACFHVCNYLKNSTTNERSQRCKVFVARTFLNFSSALLALGDLILLRVIQKFRIISKSSWFGFIRCVLVGLSLSYMETLMAFSHYLFWIQSQLSMKFLKCFNIIFSTIIQLTPPSFPHSLMKFPLYLY